MSESEEQDREIRELDERLAALAKDPKIIQRLKESQDAARRFSKQLKDADRIDPEIFRQPVTM